MSYEIDLHLDCTGLPERCGLLGYVGTLTRGGLMAIKTLKGSESDATMGTLDCWQFQSECLNSTKDYSGVFSDSDETQDIFVT